MSASALRDFVTPSLTAKSAVGAGKQFPGTGAQPARAQGTFGIESGFLSSAKVNTALYNTNVSRVAGAL